MPLKQVVLATDGDSSMMGHRTSAKMNAEFQLSLMCIVLHIVKLSLQEMQLELF